MSDENKPYDPNPHTPEQLYPWKEDPNVGYHPIAILVVISRWMRHLDTAIDGCYGDESDQRYRFLAVDENMEALIDSIDGARQSIQQNINRELGPWTEKPKPQPGVTGERKA